MDAIRYTFTKAERLCSLKLISQLFDNGSSFNHSFLRVVWTESPVPLTFPAQVIFSVSKKSFRHAVTRNLAKRRLRESYRKNKHLLYDALSSPGKQLLVAIILRGSSVPGYSDVEMAMKSVIEKLAARAGKC